MANQFPNRTDLKPPVFPELFATAFAYGALGLFMASGMVIAAAML